jgi:hypothetical protein
MERRGLVGPANGAKDRESDDAIRTIIRGSPAVPQTSIYGTILAVTTKCIPATLRSK